jgi:hypothetical protein
VKASKVENNQLVLSKTYIESTNVFPESERLIPVYVRRLPPEILNKYLFDIPRLVQRLVDFRGILPPTTGGKRASSRHKRMRRRKRRTRRIV